MRLTLVSIASALASSLLTGAPCPAPHEAAPYLPDAGYSVESASKWLMRELEPGAGEAQILSLADGCVFFAVKPAPGRERVITADECAARQHFCAAAVADRRHDRTAERRELEKAIASVHDDRDQDWTWTLAEVAELAISDALGGKGPERVKAADEAYARADAALAWLVAHGQPAFRDHARCRRIRDARIYLKEPLEPARRAEIEKNVAQWKSELPACHEGDEKRPIAGIEFRR